MSILLLKANSMPAIEEDERVAGAWLVVVVQRPGAKENQVPLVSKMVRAEILVQEDTWVDFNNIYLGGKGL